MSSYLLFLLLFLAGATAATATTVAATEKYCKCPSSTGFVCRVTKKDSEYLGCDIIDGTLEIYLSVYDATFPDTQNGVFAKALSFAAKQVRGSITITGDAAAMDRTDDFTATFPSLTACGSIQLTTLWKAIGTFSAPKLTCLGGRGVVGLDRGTSCTNPGNTPVISVGTYCHFVVDVGSASGGVNVLGSITDSGEVLDLTKAVILTVNGDITLSKKPPLKVGETKMLSFPDLTAINGTLVINGNGFDGEWPTLSFPKLQYVYSIVFGSWWGNWAHPASAKSVAILLPALKAVGGPAAVAKNVTFHGQGPGMFCDGKNDEGCLRQIQIGPTQHTGILSSGEDCRALNRSTIDAVVAAACQDNTPPIGVQEGLNYCPFTAPPVPTPPPAKPDPSMSTLYCDEISVALGYADIHECSVYDGTFTVGGVAVAGKSSPPVYNDVFSVRRINGDLQFFETELNPLTEEFVARFPYLESINGEFLSYVQCSMFQCSMLCAMRVDLFDFFFLSLLHWCSKGTIEFLGFGSDQTVRMVAPKLKCIGSDDIYHDSIHLDTSTTLTLDTGTSPLALTGGT